MIDLSKEKESKLSSKERYDILTFATEIADENGFLNCYNGEIEGFYLDEKEKIYYPCFSTCKKCIGSGNTENNNCIQCFSNYTLYNNNCEMIVPDTTIFSDENFDAEGVPPF